MALRTLVFVAVLATLDVAHAQTSSPSPSESDTSGVEPLEATAPPESIPSEPVTVAPIDPEALARLSLEELLDVEITSSTATAQTSRDAPSIVGVVTQEQIDDYGWITLNDVLYRQPGFAPSRDYDRRTVSSRGLFEGWNNNHLLMLVDGVPMNEPLYGSALTWEVTPLWLGQTIEIIRGPGSALYGSNATNGVISLSTPDPATMPHQGLFRSRIGSQGHMIFDALAGSANEHVGAVIGANVFRTAGYEYDSFDGSGRTDGAGNPAAFRVGDDRNNVYVFGKIQGYGRFDGLQLQVHYQAWNYQTNHGWLWAIPDSRESMRESRLAALATYERRDGRISQWYAVRFQDHDVDWNVRFFPNGTTAYGNTYPNGVTERLDTGAFDILARARVTVHLPRESSVLVGVDDDVFAYNGDRGHSANANLATDFTPTTNGEFVDLPSFLQWIDGHPINSLGAYGQFVSGRLFGDIVSATVGARYDRVAVRYTAIDDPALSEEQRNFHQFSPRIGLVFRATDDLSIKLLGGRAFRAPTPTELAGANTLALASNIRSLRPEVITTAELGSEWHVREGLVLRLTGFFTRFEDQIAYSTTGANLSTNLYSVSTLGTEAEVLYEFGPVQGFANYSFAHRLDEDIADPGIARSNRLTWAPAHVANFGAVYRQGDFTGSLSAHVQGRVHRRSSDVANATNLALRGSTVPGWVGLDARVAYRPVSSLELAVLINNALDGVFRRGGHPMLVKNNDYPFDYRVDGRRILGTMTVTY